MFDYHIRLLMFQNNMDNMRWVGGKPLVCMRAGAAIFVQMVAEKFSEMCMRVRACVHLS